MLIKIIQPETDLHLINSFLENAGSSLATFRYFQSRPVDIVRNHIVTVIAMDNLNPVGYGHLDPENGIVWLGVAVSENYLGKSIGKKIVATLIAEARERGIPEIRLSVDKINKAAIRLYEMNGFVLSSTKPEYLVYTLNMS